MKKTPRNNSIDDPHGLVAEGVRRRSKRLLGEAPAASSAKIHNDSILDLATKWAHDVTPDRLAHEIVGVVTLSPQSVRCAILDTLTNRANDDPTPTFSRVLEQVFGDPNIMGHIYPSPDHPGLDGGVTS